MYVYIYIYRIVCYPMFKAFLSHGGSRVVQACFAFSPGVRDEDITGQPLGMLHQGVAHSTSFQGHGFPGSHKSWGPHLSHGDPQNGFFMVGFFRANPIENRLKIWGLSSILDWVFP